MTDTTRLGMTLVEGTDTIGATGGFKDKVNAALITIDGAAGKIICTSTTRPTTGLFPGIQAYETDTKQNIFNPTGIAGTANWRTETAGSSGAGGARSFRPIRPYNGDTAHSAFPGVVVLPNNKLLICWRVGTTHTSIDGAIRGATSTDLGKTWSSSFLLWNGVSGVDFRDPQLSLSRSGTRVYITYFKAVSGNPGAGVFFRYSDDEGVTWSSEVRIEVHFRAASSAPCVELDNGTLVIPYYGRQVSGDTFDSCYTSKSINGGTSWQSAVKIIDGVAAGDHRQEPYITMKGQTGVMTYRHGNVSQIGVSTTADNTANWSGGIARFAGTGRPATCWVNDGALACVYRSVANGDAMIRTTRDNGATWSPPRLVEPAWNTGGFMTYAAMDKVSPESAIMVMGNEAGPSQSRIFISYVGESGAVTPFGALPSQQDLVWNNEDNQIFATNFEQSNGALQYPWYVLTGAVTVADGEVQSASADNVTDIIGMYTGSSDMEVEAEINCGGTGTIQSGAAIIFRMVSVNTYLMFTVEGQGVNYRLYKVVSGTATVLERNGDSPGSPFDYSVGVRTLPFNSYVRYRIVCREKYIWVYLNDQWIVVSSGAGQVFPSAMLSAADQAIFAPGRFAGVKLNSQGTTTHKCRYFSVRG
jgi:hypothetical protein